MNTVLKISVENILPEAGAILMQQGVPEQIDGGDQLLVLAKKARKQLAAILAPTGVMVEVTREEFADIYPGQGLNDAMTPLDDAGWTHPDEAVIPVLERMLASGQERLLVLDDSNRLLGVVSSRDITAFLRSQPALRGAAKAG